MLLPRETIYQALFAMLQAKLGSSFATISRRWRMPNAIAPEVRPALFQVQTGEKAVSNASGMPKEWLLHVDLVIYSGGSGDDDNFIPSADINALVDLVEKSIQSPTIGDKNTLSGVVFNCRLQGEVKIVENVNGPMAMAVIPVVIISGSGL